MSLAAAALALVPWAPFQVPLAELARDSLGHLGWCLYDVGDLDGDGLDELAAAYAGRFVDSTCCSVVNVFSVAPHCREHRAEFSVARERYTDWTLLGDACGEALVVLRRDAGGFELAIGAPGAGPQGKSCGVVETFTSLADERPRLRWKGNASADEFGAALARIPDRMGDGLDDLAIGAPGDGDGRVLVVSTRDGRELSALTPGKGLSRFGAALASTFDVRQGSRRHRLAVGAPASAAADDTRGAVLLHELRDGSLVRSISGQIAGEHFGARLASDDVDRDGAPELIVVSLGEGAVRARISAVRNSSLGRNWTHELAAAAQLDGTNISTCGDLDGDGGREVLVTFVPLDPLERPEFLVLSGLDGHVVHAVRSVAPELEDLATSRVRAFRDDTLGLALGRHLGASSAGDQDGDGVHDVWFAVGSGYGGAALQATLSLLSGAELGSGRTRARALPPCFEVPCDLPSADDDGQCARLEIGELRALRGISLGDRLDADDRGWVCTDTAFGKGLEFLGDLDADGLDELWIAGIGDVSDNYRSYLWSSKESELGAPFKSGDFSGAARVGDLDGDGRDDFVLGASERTYRFCEMVGELCVFTERGSAASYRVKHPGGAYEFARALELVGDVDCDGVRELAVATPSTGGWGYPYASRAPRACEVALLGLGQESATFLRTLEGDASASDRFGAALAFGGDWDGDGTPDLAVGAPASSLRAPRAGAVQVYSGADWRCLASFASSVPAERFGTALEWARDLDGDARSELIVSAPLHGADGHGRVVVLSSRSSSALYQSIGPRPWSAYGVSLALADFDRDGSDELVVGAPGTWHEGPSEPGTASILAVSNGRELARIRGAPRELVDFTDGVEWTMRLDPASSYDFARPGFGRALAVARDLDGGGAPDLAIGEPAYSGPSFGGMVHTLSDTALRELIGR